MAKFHELTVGALDHDTSESVVVSFDVPDSLKDSFAFTPGQYLTLRAELSGEDTRRSYSICSGPGEPLRVGIKRVAGGRFSTFAKEQLAVGDTLQVMAPTGRFIRAETSKPSHHVAFAAGSGITPILSILTHVLEERPEDRCTLFYGNRALGGVMFLDALHRLKDRHMRRLRIFHCLSREASDVPLLQGRLDAERVEALAKAGLVEAADVDVAYLCGPGSMIDEVSQGLASLGVPDERVRFERFDTGARHGPAEDHGPGTKTPAAPSVGGGEVEVEVVLDGHRRRFTMAAGQSVIEAGAEAGVELPWSCGGGMCSTCRCRLVAGEAEMKLNYSLEPWELERGYVLACQSMPKSERLVLDFDEQ